MSDYTGHYYSRNAVLKETAGFNPDIPGKGVILYEVLRIQEGICLFLEDHLDRLQGSVKLSGFDYSVNPLQFRELLGDLIRKNDILAGNIKIVLHFPVGVPPVVYAFFIPHFYPTSSMYSAGADTALFTATRPEPNVKKLTRGVRDKAEQYIRSENLYEVLLVNEAGLVSEGSRSNVFFIRHDLIRTPPGDQVLKGITRNKVIQLCRKLNIKLIEDPISIDELNKFEAVFLTGTSPKVLPVRRIGSMIYNPDHQLTRLLAVAYDELAADYIRQRRHTL